MKQTGDFRDIDTDFRTGMPEVRIFPNRALATESGVSVDTIANTVNAAIGGAVQGQYTNGDRRYDVRLRLEGGERLSPADITALDVRTDYNELIPIANVITTKTVDTYQTIARTLRERSISIFANVAPGVSQASALNRAEQIARQTDAARLSRLSRRRSADFPRDLLQPHLRAYSRHRRFLHGAGLAVQQLHPSPRRAAGAAF